MSIDNYFFCNLFLGPVFCSMVHIDVFSKSQFFFPARHSRTSNFWMPCRSADHGLIVDQFFVACVISWVMILCQMFRDPWSRKLIHGTLAPAPATMWCLLWNALLFYVVLLIIIMCAIWCACIWNWFLHGLHSVAVAHLNVRHLVAPCCGKF